MQMAWGCARPPIIKLECPISRAGGELVTYAGVCWGCLASCRLRLRRRPRASDWTGCRRLGDPQRVALGCRFGICCGGFARAVWPWRRKAMWPARGSAPADCRAACCCCRVRGALWVTAGKATGSARQSHGGRTLAGGIGPGACLTRLRAPSLGLRPGHGSGAWCGRA